ncbi:hypothetical protein [Spongiibacter marinus]|uniref:hypothetical protein n=1 Tax=Spongiibacter marinus TaxID=354246 RepID=UPI0035629AEE
MSYANLLPEDTLVITIAINGYGFLYQRNIASQRRYAQRNHYHYQAVTRPYYSPLGMEVAWLKLHLIRYALLSGYKQVLFVDADAYIQPQCPPLSEAVQDGYSIYAARGYSDRVNSGVLLLLSSPESIAFLDRVISMRDKAIPDSDDVGWGENGHVIHCLKDEPSFFELSNKWNNNSDPGLADYIRHFSAGPLRQRYQFSRPAKALFICLKLANGIRRRLAAHDLNVTVELDKLAQQCLTTYPQLNHTHR